jgi:hypothetical protein
VVDTRAMAPPILLVCGLASLGVGLALLRWLGPRLRVARLLAATPAVSPAAAIALARAGTPRYIRTQGRVSSEEEFPDEEDRPLVYRRRRLEMRPPGARQDDWRVLEDEREAVDFGIAERGDFIKVDAAALEEGLVVLSREAEGLANEIPERLPPEVDPMATIRHRVLQISAVEHIHVAGVPTLDTDGLPQLTAGLGRPLIVSALERGEAMRVIAGGRHQRLVLASGLLAVGALLVTAALALGLIGLLAPGPARAASPSPVATVEPASASPITGSSSPTAGAATGDTRTSGQGPGLVGEPFLALFGVIAVGVLTVGATMLLVRFERRD